MVRRFFKSVEEKYAHRLLWRRMDEHRDPDPYYLSCALAYKTAQILLFLALFVFTALSLIVHADKLTYDNLFYFAKAFLTHLWQNPWFMLSLKAFKN